MLLWLIIILAILAAVGGFAVHKLLWLLLIVALVLLIVDRRGPRL